MPTVSKGALRLYKMKAERLLRAVPTLDLRRKQLNRELAVWEEELRKLTEQYEALKKKMEENPHPEVDMVVAVEGVDTEALNVAGVILERVTKVRFRPLVFSFLSTPPSFDEFLLLRREELDAHERLEVKKRSFKILMEELAVTTQRINLFEKRLIPNYQEQIHYIRGRLEDNERASVMVAKIAQAEILAEQYAPEMA